MNIPVNGKFLNVSHSKTNLVTNTAIDTYSNQPLYFNSFYYTPSNQFSAFTSNLHSYYSALDKSNEDFRPTGDNSNTLKNVSYTTGVNSVNGVAVSDANSVTEEMFNESIVDGCPNYIVTGNTITSGRNRGYFPSEIVEGGSMEWIDGEPPIRISGYSCCQWYKNPTKDISAIYFSPIYNTTGNTLNYNLGSGNQIVMRSDRLPSSTVVDETNCNGLFNYYILII